MTSARNQALALVDLEINRAQQLHGVLPADRLRALAILTEEVGELAAALLGLRRGETTEADALMEATQVAAVAVLITEGLLQTKGTDR